jgi:hypothetical protein
MRAYFSLSEIFKCHGPVASELQTSNASPAVTSSLKKKSALLSPSE